MRCMRLSAYRVHRHWTLMMINWICCSNMMGVIYSFWLICNSPTHCCTAMLWRSRRIFSYIIIAPKGSIQDQHGTNTEEDMVTAPKTLQSKAQLCNSLHVDMTLHHWSQRCSVVVGLRRQCMTRRPVWIMDFLVCWRFWKIYICIFSNCFGLNFWFWAPNILKHS